MADGAPQPADALPPPSDAPPQYPPGPYGTDEGSVIENLSFTGYMDTAADADNDPFNEQPTTIDLGMSFAGRDPAAKVLLVVTSAGYCEPCKDEARHLPKLAAKYGPRGARFIEALKEDNEGNPADTEFVRSWGREYMLTVPTVADPFRLLDVYGPELPNHIFIDAKTMKILKMVCGVGTSQDIEGHLESYTR